MPYRPIAASADDRRAKQGCAPITLDNCLVRQTPPDDPHAARAPLFIGPTPGRTLRATMIDNVRGLFSEPGCRSGNLFIPNGSVLSEMTSSLSYTDVGAIGGGDVVQMRADRDDLRALAFGTMYGWDGSTFTEVTDPDAPEATAIAVVGGRLLGIFPANDIFGWALAGDFTDWPANNQAAAADLPDPLLNLEEIGGDAWCIGSRSTQIFQPTGGAEESAFAKVQGVNIKVGAASRDAFAKMGAGGMLLGDNRVVHGTRGYGLEPVPNLALTQDLKALTPNELSECVAWSYEDGEKEFWGLSAGLAKGYVFDAEMGLWHTRSRYGEDEYDIDFAASAFGRVFVASRSSMKVWSLDEDVYTDGVDDNGDDIPLIRDMTISISSAGDVPVSKLVWDMVTRDVPLEGQGSSPVMRVRTSNNGGESWSDWREIALPTPANRFRVQDFGFGLATVEHGMLIQMRITDPIGWAVFGVWVNPSPEEINAA